MTGLVMVLAVAVVVAAVALGLALGFALDNVFGGGRPVRSAPAPRRRPEGGHAWWAPTVGGPRPRGTRG